MFFIAKTKFEKRVRTGYWIIFVVGCIYFYHINVDYQVSEYNLYLLPPLVSLVLTPVLHWLGLSQRASAWLMFVSGALIAYVQLFIGGGMSATGICWLTVVPLIGGLVLEKPGVYIGVALTGAVLALFMLLDGTGHVPYIEKMFANYQSEKRFDDILFAMTMCFFAIYFIRSQLAAEREIDRQKERFEGLLGMVIHDMATPLLVIESSARAALSKSEQTAQHLERIVRHCGNLVDLLGGIREMKAVADTKLEVMTECSDLNALLQEACESCRERAEKKGIKLSFESSSTEGLAVMVDPGVFKNSIIGNLLSNAIKFTERGKSVTIGIIEGRSDVVIEVKDQGVGIPAEILALLFECNAKTTRFGTEGEKGTGYGMVLVKQWTEAMNGKIEVHSRTFQLGKGESGTTFRLIFPRHKLLQAPSADLKSAA